MKRAAVLALLAGMLGSACAHHPEEPAATVSAFGAALARGDSGAAYRLTSLDFQRRIPFDAFAAGFTAGGGEPAALGRRMVAEAPGLHPRVEVTLALGERVPLVLEGGRWRIDAPIYEAWGQATPRAAVLTFIRAVDARRYDVVLRLCPDRYRARLSAERLRTFWEGEQKEAHHALLERMRASAGASIVEVGDEARLELAPDRQVRLVREAGEWKIEDPDEY